DAEQPLDLADDEGAVAVQDGQGEELDLLEVPGAAAVAGQRQAELRDDVKKALGESLQPYPRSAGNHGDFPQPVRPESLTYEPLLRPPRAGARRLAPVL